MCSVALGEEKKDTEKARDARDVSHLFTSPFKNNYYNHYNPFHYRHPQVYTAPTFEYHPTAKYAYKTAEAAAPILKMNTESHPDGSYNYEYETGNGIRAVESSLQNGLEHIVRGSYSYVAPDGKTYTVHYIADRNGYRAYGDHLPQQPDEVAPLEASRLVSPTLVPSASVVVPVESSTVHPVVSVTPTPVVSSTPFAVPKTVVVPPRASYYTHPRYYNPYQTHYDHYNPYFVPTYQQYVNPYPYFVSSTVAPSVLVNKK
ncbi:cuticle protein 19.8 isoform X8 [Lutzomyia longipalpis]|nr:cuticle protein 19.8 isoform X8 [Lutzomyia longipalpis]